MIVISPEKNIFYQFFQHRAVFAPAFDDGETRASGLVRITCSGDNSPFALNEEIVRFDIAVRSVLTVAGQGAVNQPRVWLAELLVSKAETPGDTGSIVFKKDV